MISAFKSAARRAYYIFSTNTKICSSFVLKISFHNSNFKRNQHEPAKLTDQNQSPTEKQDDTVKKDCPYYIENGLRKVYPYYYNYSTFCKGRWIKRTLVDIYLKEFGLFSRENIERRILNGHLLVNGKRVGLDYELKNSDFLTGYIHRHELPVLATPIKVLYEDDDLLVIDKPPSIPVHPCGLYRFNTVIYLLAEEQNRNDLHVIHRLDRLTSGVLLFTKTSEKSRELHNEIDLRNVEKEYLCRVEGNFPDGVVVCDKPLKQFYHKMGVSLVDPTGKPSMTEFEKLSFNGKSSVVLCRPKTGRTHQIRVHLQYLGYPIVNDPLYNSYVFGPDKGKHGELHKSKAQLLEDLLKEHTSEFWFADSDVKLDTNSEFDISQMNLNSGIDYTYVDKALLNTIYKKDPERITHEKNCYFCSKTFKDPKPSNLVLFLHALRYKGDKWEFSSEKPSWANSDWDIM